MSNTNTLSDKAFKLKFPGAKYTGARGDTAQVQIGNQTYYWEQSDDLTWWNIEIRTTYTSL